jgi:hypothetical protein
METKTISYSDWNKGVGLSARLQAVTMAADIILALFVFVWALSWSSSDMPVIVQEPLLFLIVGLSLVVVGVYVFDFILFLIWALYMRLTSPRGLEGKDRPDATSRTDPSSPLTIAKVAEATGVSKATVHKWIRGYYEADEPPGLPRVDFSDNSGFRESWEIGYPTTKQHLTIRRIAEATGVRIIDVVEYLRRYHDRRVKGPDIIFKPPFYFKVVDCVCIDEDGLPEPDCKHCKGYGYWSELLKSSPEDEKYTLLRNVPPGNEDYIEKRLDRFVLEDALGPPCPACNSPNVDVVAQFTPSRRVLTGPNPDDVEHIPPSRNLLHICNNCGRISEAVGGHVLEPGDAHDLNVKVDGEAFRQ